MLIAENTGESLPAKSSSDKFKRLKKNRDELGLGMDFDDRHGSAEGERLDEATLEKDLFGDDEEDDQDQPPQDQRPAPEEDFDSEEEELDDFIVYGPDEEQERRKARKERRHAGTMGISQSQLDEAASIFGGDMSEFLQNQLDEEDYDYEGDEERPRRQKAEASSEDVLEQIKQQYEPSLLAEKFITTEDERIRRTDIPERLQLRFPGLELPPVEREILGREAEWIFSRVFQHRPGLDTHQHAMVTRIMQVLEFIRKQNYEVPFIAHYRKDYWRCPQLSPADLWLIYEWDEKFIHILTKKANLRAMYMAIEGLEEEYYGELIESCDTDQDVKDLHDHFQLHYHEAIEQVSTSRYKRPVKRDFYTVCKKTGLVEFANKSFGLTAKQFGDNLMDSVLTHTPANPEPDPETLAAEFMNSPENREFVDVESVLKASRYVLAREIAYDPHVRTSLRSTFYDHVEVSTFPTPKGRKEIDRLHEYFNVKRLEKKPIWAFKDSAQFLQIVKAEKEGYITATISIPNEADFLQEMEQLYLSDGYSLNAQKWNEQRRLVLKEALTANLYPLFRTELRAKMTQEALDHVLARSTANLRRELMRGPFKPISSSSRSDYYDDEDDRMERLVGNTKVMGCVWGQGEAPTICIVVDRDGQPLELLKLNFINMRSDEHAPELDRRRKEQELDQLRDFISDHTPHAIVVGAGPNEIDSRRFFEELTRAATTVEARKDLRHRIHVTYADSRIAKIYKNSSRSQKEFPDYAPLAREAVCLARFLQNPLIEYCGLTLDGAEEVLCLPFHPQQELVPKELLHQHLMRTFIDVVNEVGVDINHAVQHKFAAGPLQFTAGLGPRKAQALLQALERKGGLVSSREEIDAALQTFSTPSGNPDDEDRMSVVYTNCAGFLRVCNKYFLRDHRDIIDPLDDTRIHPDDYGFARKMAADALDEEEDEGSSQVEAIIRRPQKLEDIDLESFAEEWERSGKGKKAVALQDIRRELGDPYADPRDSYRDLTPDQLFYLLTGETETTLRAGQLVHAKVFRVSRDIVFCRLDNGLFGSIRLLDLTDSAVQSPDDVVVPGQYLACRVLSVDKEKFSVALASSHSKLNDPTLGDHYGKLDPYLLEKEAEQTELPRDLAAIQRKKAAAAAAGGAQRRAPARKKPQRTITHPLFRSCSWREAEDLLRDKEPGADAIIIRPSSQGSNHLNISWKLTDTVCIHTDVVERSSKKWEVEKQVYEDMDELIYRFIEPMTEFGREMQNYRLYRAEGRDSIEQRLRQDRETNPARIPYYVIPSPDQSRRFTIAYWHQKPRFESVAVTHEGYRYRGHHFKNPEKLIAYFKANFKNPRPSRVKDAARETHGPAIHPTRLASIAPHHHQQPPPPMVPSPWGQWGAH
ncbi:S1 RNA binding domain containing protein [Acanthamoeba castellanii str. Neff]|uniref:S1 RNA binding domain containing protein n=1 Tax=Acanthamoeba castellanii (strain ATCC 30010 / Neff) TaxID=1257118 RepID=L8HFM7_ACACF|nr:S1 RNA binding domain containing protein [Acanthamoeba castellanii str. Neff]ELR24047.1 S1 RNA binding domain containing protein [Acanthamoeba castellanii str. Neff]